jgi:DNA-directed RNA polymerase subunit F
MKKQIKKQKKITQKEKFMKESFMKAIKVTEESIKKFNQISNTLIILKKDFSVELIDVCDKDGREIRNILANYNMIGYIYTVECDCINKITKKKRRVVLVGMCQSNHHERITIEFKDNKIIDRTAIKERNENNIDILDLWGNFEFKIK